MTGDASPPGTEAGPPGAGLRPRLRAVRRAPSVTPATAVGLRPGEPAWMCSPGRISPRTTQLDAYVTDPAVLRRVLAEVRKTGIAISDRQIDEDAYSFGAPVTGPDGGCVAALSIVVGYDDPGRASGGHAVRAAAIGISRRLRDAWAADAGCGVPTSAGAT